MLLPHALRCLQHANVRRFFAGQSISLVGSWMQSVAMGWLVYRLTGRSEMLGLVAFLSQVPVFLFATWAGSLADRVDRRRMVMATQANALVQATLLAALTFTGQVQVWHLLVLSVMLGLTYAFEIPARHALLADIAGADTPNAVALNSTVVNVARVAGPALAGLLVASVGEAWCFALNAVSFVATLSALARMQGLARPAAAPARGWRHLVDGVAYARRTVMVRALLSLSLVASFFALPYQTLMPLIAARQLGGGAALLGRLLACAGAGALAGALLLLVRKDGGGLARRVGWGAALLASGLLGLSLARTPLAAGLSLCLTGFGFITQLAGTMTLLQGLVPRELRGRVMGLFSTLFVGATPFGALAGGWAAAQLGAPLTVRIGACVLALGALAFHLSLPGLRREAPAQHPGLAALP